MNKTAAILALVSFLSVPVGASFAGTTTSTTSSQTSSPRASSPPSAPAPRTASTSFGTFGSAPKPTPAAAPAPKPAPVVAAPVPKPVAAPAPVQKSVAFGTTGNAPIGKTADAAPPRSASAMSADLTRSSEQKRALADWDSRNRTTTAAPTGVSREHVLPDSGNRRTEPPAAIPSQGDRSLAFAREQAYREQQARREQQRVEELRIERLREERRLELARMERERQRTSVNGSLVTGVAVGSVLAHDRQPTAAVQESVPASPARDERQFQRSETSNSVQGESSGSGVFWFFVILLSLSVAGAAYWFLNRKPAFAGPGNEPVRRKPNYDLK